MRAFDDPEFGPFEDTGYTWTLARRATVAGHELRVEVAPETVDAAGPSPGQRAALRVLFALPADALDRSAGAVVQNYEVYREVLDDEMVPPLAAPADVWRAVEPRYVSVPAHGSNPVPTFLLMAECDWDPEHGLAVRFRDGLADAASQQGELGMDD